MSPRVTTLPYGKQSIGDDDVAAVTAALRDDWLTQGPAVGAVRGRAVRDHRREACDRGGERHGGAPSRLPRRGGRARRRRDHGDAHVRGVGELHSLLRRTAGDGRRRSGDGAGLDRGARARHRGAAAARDHPGRLRGRPGGAPGDRGARTRVGRGRDRGCGALARRRVSSRRHHVSRRVVRAHGDGDPVVPSGQAPDDRRGRRDHDERRRARDQAARAADPRHHARSGEAHAQRRALVSGAAVARLQLPDHRSAVRVGRLASEEVPRVPRSASTDRRCDTTPRSRGSLGASIRCACATA